MPATVILKRSGLAVLLLSVIAGAFGCEKGTPPKPLPTPSTTPQLKPLVKPPLKWINLVGRDLTDWMYEAGNAGHALCGRAPTAKLQACLQEKMPAEQRTRSWTYPLHAGPSKQSELLGALRVTAKVFAGFALEYVARDGVAIAFESDAPLSFADSEAMLQTVLEEREGWVLLPPRPFPSAVWMETGQQFAVLEAGLGGEVFTWNGRSIVILEVTDAGVVAREEIPTDYDCGDGAAPTPEDQIKRFIIPWPELYDKDHHLLLKQKYTMC